MGGALRWVSLWGRTVCSACCGVGLDGVLSPLWSGVGSRWQLWVPLQIHTTGSHLLFSPTHPPLTTSPPLASCRRSTQACTCASYPLFGASLLRAACCSSTVAACQKWWGSYLVPPPRSLLSNTPKGGAGSATLCRGAGSATLCCGLHVVVL